MRYYTKEWYKLLQSIGTVDLFEPVIDKEYSDSEIEALYQDMLEKHVQEERDSYDEPPMFDLDEWMEDFPEEEFDPDDYLISDFDEDGEEINFRNPETYEELKQYQIDEYEREWKEFESRPPFDEEESVSDFEENYRDSLEEPDEDIPKWVLEEVDPRLIAIGVLPEGVYERLRAEEEEMQLRFDEIEELADAEYDSYIEDIIEADPDALNDLPEWLEPDHLVSVIEDLNEIDSDYVLSTRDYAGDFEIEFLGWDDEGDDVIRTLIADSAEIIEIEDLHINAEPDEDGDVIPDCELAAYELYWDDEGFELHLMFDNNGLKYCTMKCKDITCTQRQPDIAED